MKILFITTHNLATNPRFVKEVHLAIESGYNAEIICFEFNNWSKGINERMFQQLGKVHIVKIPAGRKPFVPWFAAALKESMYRFIGKFAPLPLAMLSQAVSRRSDLLMAALDKISNADLVIGHNPGAMWPAIRAAKKFNCLAGFDVEDYHPGEGNSKYLQKLNRQLMKRLLPQMKYVSFASPLIRQQVQTDVGIPGVNWFTVLNYFPVTDFKEPLNIQNGPVKIVWFSQNINTGRGLELVLPVVKEFNGKAELHLIGNLNTDFYENNLKDIPNIIVYPPMRQKDLHKNLAQFDIGLALEPAKDKNNELAVSNKILAYLQAGLFIVATNTAAQEWLLKKFPGHGWCFDYRASGAKSVIEKVVTEIDTIRSLKNKRYKTFENRNWEKASLDLLKRWKEK